MRKRFPVSKQKSKRQFKRSSGTNSMNRQIRTVKRGGWRL